MKTYTIFPLFLVFAASVAGCDGSSTAPSNATVATPPDVIVVDANGSTSFSPNVLSDQLALLPLGVLTAEEEAGLIFMREEEKLAHDVYIRLNTLWQQVVFSNIALSEQTHTEAVLRLLERYAVPDPVGPNPAGVFVDPALQGLYDLLTAQGSVSLVDALVVGAEIEEIDILDLDRYQSELDANEDIRLVYENLQKGSRNHLRAFVNALAMQNVTYVPQHLSTQAYEEIINSPTESGGNR